MAATVELADTAVVKNSTFSDVSVAELFDNQATAPVAAATAVSNVSTGFIYGLHIVLTLNAAGGYGGGTSLPICRC